jgi:hypothetical protein
MPAEYVMHHGVPHILCSIEIRLFAGKYSWKGDLPLATIAFHINLNPLVYHFESV